MLTSIMALWTHQQIIAQCHPNPIVTGTTSIVCGQTTTLTASGAGSKFGWFNAPTGGSLLSSSNVYTTSALLANDTVWVETFDTSPSSISFTSSGQNSWVVPAGVFFIDVDIRGAQGGDYSTALGGAGGRVVARVPVTPGQTIHTFVGAKPTSTTGGWNGGGNGVSSGRGGGGASDIRIGGTSLNNRVVVAGGGGGAGWNCGANQERGGRGGGPGTAENGFYCNGYNSSYSGRGADQVGSSTNNGYCGCGSGSFGQGGNGYTTNCGGGGGGWYGGGGAGYYSGGGGGSSYAFPSATNVSHTMGFQTGNGSITITWEVVTCASNRLPVPISVNSFVAPPVTSGASVTCGFSTMLSASGSSGIYRWFNVPTGGTPIASGSTFNSPSIFSSQTFYVEGWSVNTTPNCKSSRVAVVVNNTSVPIPIVVNDTAICGSNMTLQATGSTGLFNWYTSLSGGSPIHTGTSYNVNNLTTTTYYVEATSNLTPNGSQTFTYSGGMQPFVVPSDVTQLTVDVRGAQGGDYSTANGGQGGRVTATLNVTPGETLFVYVGQKPTSTSGGWNGGGVGVSNGRGGGGGSDIRQGGTSTNNRVVVAGGGGGAGWNCGSTQERGGRGGGPGSAESGFHCNSYNSSYSGRGADQIGTNTNNGYCGCGTGSFFQGGNGYTTNCGGGGGGWYGGGGAGYYAGGGGGSSYANPNVTSAVSHTMGFQNGHGEVIISWSSPVCTSPRVPAVAVVTPLPNPTPVPDTVNCSSSATLSVSGSSGSYRWYTQPSGGSPIAQGSILATQPMFQPTTYYVEAFNPLNTCLSARVPVQVLIDSLPLATVSGSDTLCDNGSTIFTASGGSGTYTWHATPGGPVLQSGATYSTGAVTSPVMVYARYGSGSCFSGFAPGVLLIVPTPVATITAPSTLCSSDPLQQFTAPSIGGTWSGNGIVNTSTGSFSPSSASLGSNQIIYSINTLGCSDADTVQVTINQGPSVSIVDPGPQCTQNSALTLSSSTPGGTWSGPGITNASSGSFDPSVALNGVHDVIYSLTVSGCTGSDTVQIPVYANPSASLQNPGPLCSTAGAVALSAQTPGGSFTGSALSNPSLGVFDPSLAQSGLNKVVYTVSQNGCSSTDSIFIQVNTTPSAAIQSPGVLCSSQNVVVLNAASSGGSWSGVGIQNAVLGTFSPSNAQLGSNVVTYSVSQNGCSDQQSITITVNQSPDATISSAPSSVCSNAGLVTLGSLFSGGSWSGSGIVSSSAGTLQPSLMNAGNNTITYSLTQNGCTSQQSVVISRLQAPDGTILSQPGQVCSNASDVNLFASSPGGFWTGNGIVNAATGTFSPLFAGTGQSTIVYNVSQNGCTDGDTIQINVVSAPVTQVSPSGVQQACEGVGIPLTANGANGYQWYLNGQAISGATGSSYTAQLNGTYTVEGTSNGCASLSSQVQAQLSARPEILSLNAASVCEGLPTQFSNTSVVAGNTGSVITGYQWSYGDGNTGQGIQSHHTYAVAGQYQAQLVVLTNQGCSDTLSQPVFVNPRPQIQSATAPNVCQPLSTQFNAGATISPINNASVSTYQWSFGNGLSGSGSTTSHTYQSASAYTWVLTVTSNHGCVVEQSGQTEVFRKPDAGFLVNNVCTNVPAQFLDISDAYGDQITSWQWNFGDNQGLSTQQNPIYAYNTTPGQYPVSLTIQTASGCSDVSYQFVQLTPSPSALWTGTVQGNSTVNFSPVNPNPNATFIWHFPGDNTYAYQMNVSKTFPGDGSYPVCLTVQLNGCESTECSSITLNTTSVSTLEDLGVSVYPNPSAGMFTVDMNGSKAVGASVSLSLRDMSGREVLTQQVAGSVFEVDARGVSTGTYLLILTTDEGQYQSRMVITR